MNTESVSEPAPGSPRRIIKRYSNRKLYDTQGSTYVTLLQIAQMIREGEEVQIIDNASKEDKTDVTLALIISEELRNKPRAVPLSTLKALIRHGGERILSQLRGGPMGRLIPSGSAEGESAVEPNQVAGPAESAPMPNLEDDVSETPRAGLRATLEHWQTQIDERIRAVLPNFQAFRELEQSVKRLSARLDAIEKRLGPSGGSEPPKDGGAGA
ncbi:MAG TPA: polyhydroxyalkanoate synthesis regulator DNA-binding domain-containing protein [Polyangiaceae bacterium]|nr:polyhydroxyalkanoate synthesis regulator DNA-binding domain-containing protein [Polyangiaceae bacterium]